MFDVFYKPNYIDGYPPHNTEIKQNEIVITYWNTQKERLQEFHKLIKNTWYVNEIVSYEGTLIYQVSIDDTHMAALFIHDEDAYKYCCELISRETIDSKSKTKFEYVHFPLMLRHEDALGTLMANSCNDASDMIQWCLDESESELIKKIASATQADLAEYGF